jgi:hypothetical protein
MSNNMPYLDCQYELSYEPYEWFKGEDRAFQAEEMSHGIGEMFFPTLVGG